MRCILVLSIFEFRYLYTGRPSRQIHLAARNVPVLLEVSVLLDDDDALERVIVRPVFFRRQLGSLGLTQSDGRLVRLETRNGSWLACLPNNIDSLTDANIDRQLLAIFVECDEEALQSRVSTSVSFIS